MSTVSQAVITWLKGFDSTNIKRINTDIMQADVTSYTLAKEPIVNTKAFLSGTTVVTEHYTFMARLSIKADSDRKSNVTWGEALEAWVKAQNDAQSYPTVDKNSTVQQISITTPFYVGQAPDTNTAVYELTLAIRYMRTSS